MGTVHQLIAQQGKQAAINEGFPRVQIEAACAYMGDESASIGFMYSGWCQAALPHRQQPDGKAWQIKTDHITLIVEPGNKPGPGIDSIRLGVPYGSRARLIMLYLQAEALRTRQRRVELGRSMRQWLTKMGVPVGGKSLTIIRDQAERIARCRLSFNVRGTGEFVNQTIVDDGAFMPQMDDGMQGSLWKDYATLSERFFAELQNHPVPYEEAAVRAIANNSMALDLYAWAAYRLHVLTAPTPVSWTALKGQFGPAIKGIRNFRFAFLENLRLALAVYPDAKIEIEERGLILHPSRPPVAPRQIAVGKVPTNLLGL